jgi:hypothetical protein
MHIIGFTGRMRHGKNTAATMLADAWTKQRGSSVATLAFADALKEECAESFGVDPRMFYADELKDAPQQALTLSKCREPGFVQLCLANTFPILLNEPQRPRFVLQFWGTEFRRTQDPEHWCKEVAKRIADIKHRGFGLAIITDVRFLNEANMIKDRGGSIWKIYRPNVVIKGSARAHGSEREMESMRVDATFTNDSIERLQMAITDAAQGVGR